MAIYGNEIGQEIAPAWREIWKREKRESELAKVGRIDWAALICAGDDAMDAARKYLGRPDFKGLFIGETLTGLTREAHDAALNYEKAEMALYVACLAAGVPEIAVIRAARIMNRYYDRGGGNVLDCERLIKSQI